MGATILCFGDSNTWGHNPEDMSRFAYERRWPSILQQNLGEQFLVIPEGLNGRTTVFDDPLAPHRSGIAHLPMVLQTHKPLDLVIMMLGTNDVKSYFSVSAEHIGQGVERLIQAVRVSESGPDDGTPKILVVAPVPLAPMDQDMKPHFAPEADSISKSEKLAEAYRHTVEPLEVPFLDAGSVVNRPGSDGVHLDGEGHAILGKAISQKVKSLL